MYKMGAPGVASHSKAPIMPPPNALSLPLTSPHICGLLRRRGTKTTTSFPHNWLYAHRLTRHSHRRVDVECFVSLFFFHCFYKQFI